MCDFFSCVSDGKGSVFYFKPEDVAKIMFEGNPKNYDFNSHTSVAHYHGYEGAKEDRLNKWEYNPEKNILTKDRLSATDDGDLVKKVLRAFLKNKDILWLRNLYGQNAGDSNAGNFNVGYRNAGYRNAGDSNAGSSNAGSRNAGYRNAGDFNAGNRNAGYRNAGDSNAGDSNAGSRNAGSFNVGDSNAGYFNSDDSTVRMFNKDTGLTRSKINIPSFLYNLKLTEWIGESKMTAKEKKANPKFYVMGGYLKKYDYKQAWKNLKLTQLQKSEIKKLPNFDKKIFKEITGIGIR